MTYRAEWFLADGTTPAPGPDLGTIKPGETKTVTRRLKNTGTDPLSAVQVTQVDALPGLTVTVGGQTLTPGVMYAAPALAPNASLEFVYTRTLPSDADPGIFSAFVRIRGLT